MGLPRTAARGMVFYLFVVVATLLGGLLGSGVAVAGTSALTFALGVKHAGADGIINAAQVLIVGVGEDGSACLLYTSDAADE